MGTYWDNLPDGVTLAHPYFNPPEQVGCDDCDEDVYPGEPCPNCGLRAPTEAERSEDAQIDRAEALADQIDDWREEW